MNALTSDPNRLANSFAGLHDPSMGDEREREVVMRAYVFAYVLGTLLAGVAAIVLVATGAGFLSLLPVFVFSAAAWAAIWYAGREKVDLADLAGSATRGRRVATSAVTLVIVAIWVALYVFHLANGRPFLQLSLGVGDDFSGSTAAGMAYGAAVGVFGVWIARTLHRRSVRRRAIDEAEAPDED
ncbi:hypothetical protein [Brevibacterium litoralis]|uniref:hypothetical protein n=1 Tax=Brevibacterium litoralis TaxID=3138935 RepID=UPI0032F02DB9